MSKITRVLMGGLLVGGCMTALDGESTIEQFLHDPPTNVAVTDVTPTRVTVTWDAVPGGTKYYVYQSVGPNGPFAYLNTARAPSTSLRVANLTPGTNYCFVVRTDGPEGPGADSAQACVDTPAEVVPAAPTNVSAAFSADGTRAVVNWDAVGGAVKYYLFQSANGAAGPFSYYSTAVAPSTSLQVVRLTPGGSYCWAVQSQTSDGVSAMSAPSCGAVSLCGNGTIDAGEQCDDGNNTSGDGCSATCQDEICGNGVLDPGEGCDDGNLLSGDGCSAVCQVEGCGNGVVDPGEDCDDGNLISGDGCSAVCQVEVCGNGVVDPGEECDDGNQVEGDGCSNACELEMPQPAGTLFFSEYVEGSSSNKALEIMNPTAADIELDGCQIRLYANGSATVSGSTNLSGTIPAGGVFLACHTQMSSSVTCNLRTSGGGLLFNGDDAVELVCGGETLDVIGQIGVDPGVRWGSGNSSTENNTLRRRCGVTSGDTDGSDAFVPATEWLGFGEDTFAGLGSPDCAE